MSFDKIVLVTALLQISDRQEINAEKQQFLAKQRSAGSSGSKPSGALGASHHEFLIGSGIPRAVMRAVAVSYVSFNRYPSGIQWTPKSLSECLRLLRVGAPLLSDQTILELPQWLLVLHTFHRTSAFGCMKSELMGKTIYSDTLQKFVQPTDFVHYKLHLSIDGMDDLRD